MTCHRLYLVIFSNFLHPTLIINPSSSCNFPKVLLLYPWSFVDQPLHIFSLPSLARYQKPWYVSVCPSQLLFLKDLSPGKGQFPYIVFLLYPRPGDTSVIIYSFCTKVLICAIPSFSFTSSTASKPCQSLHLLCSFFITWAPWRVMSSFCSPLSIVAVPEPYHKSTSPNSTSRFNQIHHWVQTPLIGHPWWLYLTTFLADFCLQVSCIVPCTCLHKNSWFLFRGFRRLVTWSFLEMLH